MNKTKFVLALLASTCLSFVALGQSRSTPGSNSSVIINAAPHVATNAVLASSANSLFTGGVWRDHYATGGTADGPLFFQPQKGTCAAQTPALVNDGGNCVDSTSGDGNSWKALHQNGTFNVREFGAKSDGSTDDTAAIQAAVTAAGASPAGGLVWFPPTGTYCIKSGPVNVNATVTLAGVNRQTGALLSACGADVGIWKLNAFRIVMRGLRIAGSATVGTTNEAVTTTTACGECELDDVLISGGLHGFGWYDGDIRLNDVKINHTYGPLLFMQNGGGYMRRVQLDNAWPDSVHLPVARSQPANAPNTWAGTTLYATGAIVTDAGWLLQATVGGTSGNSLPTVLSYGQNITDGSVTWQLAGSASNGALQIDSGTSALFVSNTDITGAALSAVVLTNSLATTAPQSIFFTSTDFGQYYLHGILDVAGSYGISANGSQFSNGLASNSDAVNAIGVGARYQNNQIFSVSEGFNLAATAAQTLMLGNGISNCANALLVAANTIKFTFNDNFTGDATLGVCTNAANISAGSSDFYSVIGNLLDGATISDGGTGTHKTIMGNN